MTTTTPLSVERFDVCSSDPEDAHRELRERYADFTVRLSGGTDGFRFTHTGIVTPWVTLGRFFYGAVAELDVRVPRESLIVAVRTGGDLRVDSDRESVRPDLGEPVLMPSHADWHVEMDDVSVTSLRLDLSSVRRSAESMFGADPTRLRFLSMTPVSPVATRYWSGLVEHVGRDVLEHDDLAASPLVLAAAIRSLAAAVLVTFPTSGLAPNGGHPSPDMAEPAVLRRAVAYMDEHAGEDIGITDIAVAARIGPRGLQYQFRKHLDRTPLEHLQHVRMERAHVDLRAADPTRGDTVAAVAARWGFAHAGRFSVEYRRRFGRSPSQTLRSDGPAG